MTQTIFLQSSPYLKSEALGESRRKLEKEIKMNEGANSQTQLNSTHSNVRVKCESKNVNMEVKVQVRVKVKGGP